MKIVWIFALFTCTDLKPAILSDSLKELHSCWSHTPLFNGVMSLYCLLRTAIYPTEKLWPSIPRNRQNIIVTPAPRRVIMLKEAVNSILLDATIQIIKP